MPPDAHHRDLEDDFGPVAELFGALAVPVRAAIVHRLSQGELSVGELVETLGVSQPLVSQHLRTLRQAGLVAVEREGRRAVYRLADDHVAHVLLDAYRHSHEPHPARTASTEPPRPRRARGRTT